jgi:hypothetical protein
MVTRIVKKPVQDQKNGLQIVWQCAIHTVCQIQYSGVASFGADATSCVKVLLVPPFAMC